MSDTSARLGASDSRVDRLEPLIGPALGELGFEIVRLQLSGTQRPKLQVMIEPIDHRAMTVDDCAEASRMVSAILDVEDPIAGGYVLEVSSPGLDRPLTRVKDFERFAGEEARVETAVSIDGRKRFQGRLLGVAEDSVEIEVDGERIALPFASIQKAKLVLTDRLLAAAADTDR